MIQKLNCISCGCTLYNDVNTFGEVGQEMCWTCYSSMDGYGEPEEQSWYGMAPHHHDLGLTGSYIGSTVFEPLPEESVNGWYWIADRGAWFCPDPETDGYQGMWSTKL